MNRTLHTQPTLTDGLAVRGIGTCVRRGKSVFVQFSPMHVGATATQ